MRLQIGFVTQLASVLGVCCLACSVANAANHAPTIAGTPATSVKVDAVYSFKPVARDADGNKLKFSISGKPAWATFSSSSGALSGRPNTKQAGTYKKIIISVTDGRIQRSLAAFNVRVLAANTVPKISGKPPTVIAVGSTFSFRPTASDADRDTLAYSIRNKPKWMVFSTVTGEIKGKPIGTDTGKYADISITVSDGKATATLPRFAIEVSNKQQAPGKAQAVGAVTLAWLPPTENMDGTVLNNLAGYRLHYGKKAAELDQIIQISNPSISRFVVENLPAGTYFFALKAYTKGGVESSMSEVVSTKIL